MGGSLYDAVGGGDVLLALAHAWHARCLADPIASHPFARNDLHPQHSERLAAYWGEALGGPAVYTATMGTESGVRRVHAGNGEHRELDEACIAAFVQAMDDVGIAVACRDPLEAYFRVTTDLLDQPVAVQDIRDGLTMLRWSTEGPVVTPAPGAGVPDPPAA